MKTVRVLLIGDVVGETGRIMFQKHIGKIRRELAIDAIIVNGENSGPNGRGIIPRVVHFFKHHHVNVITSGNHIWDQREIYPYLASNTDLLRPANFPSNCPGVGVTTFEINGCHIGVINVQGRIFMREHLDCPFKTVESILTYLHNKTKVIFVDFHAEATSEKRSMGYFLDGKVSGVVGTHTHVPTSDEQILPKGTGYVTDLGMVGSVNSSLGMKFDSIITHFLTQMPQKFVVETSNPVMMTGVWMDVEIQSGKTIAIQRVHIIDDQVHIDTKEEQK